MGRLPFSSVAQKDLGLTRSSSQMQPPTVTFAELSAEEKGSISHRGLAVSQFITFLRGHPDVL